MAFKAAQRVADGLPLRLVPNIQKNKTLGFLVLPKPKALVSGPFIQNVKDSCCKGIQIALVSKDRSKQKETGKCNLFATSTTQTCMPI
jgi:hypothetical protein